MNKKYLGISTLVALAGLYLGCTNPSTVVGNSDPRVPAGNADTASTASFSKNDATGVWLFYQGTGATPPPFQGMPTLCANQLVIKQLADGTLLLSSGFGNPVTKATNTSGQVHFTLATGNTPNTWNITVNYDGTISDDGTTLVLTSSSDDSQHNGLKETLVRVR